jgi:hypothetical protein
MCVGRSDPGCDKKQEQKDNSPAAFASSTNPTRGHLSPTLTLELPSKHDNHSVQYSLVRQTPNYLPSPVLPFVLITALTSPVAFDLASLAAVQAIPYQSDI